MTHLRRLILVLAVAHGAFGETVSVRLTVRDEQRGLPGEGTLRCVPLGQGTVATPEPVTTVAVAQNAVIDMDVAAPCSLELQSAAWWHPPTVIQKDQREVRVELWPAAVLTGTIAAPDPPPAEVQLRFVPAEDGKTLERRSGNMTCPVVEGRFRCVVPAGRHHLRLRSPRLIPHHRWNVAASADQPHDLGRISLREGASIEGRLTTLRSHPIRNWRDVTVSAAPAGLRDSESQGATMTVKATEHGSFQIAGLPPGEYLVAATLAKLFSEEIRVRVLPNAQVELTDPLLLQTPKQLDVTVSPPLDPAGERWTLRLTRYIERRGEIVTESQAGQDGNWSAHGLRVAEYDLDVAPSGQYSWHNARISLADSDVQLPVTISITRVRGRVSVGDRPVAGGMVHLGGRSGRIRHLVTTGGDGRYDTFAPAILGKGRLWTVEVEAEQPSIHQKLEVTAHVDGDDHVLDIVLPDLRVAGRVLNEDGAPAPHVLVNITDRLPDGMLRQISTDQAGEFVVTGLSAGAYQLQASAPGKESQTVDVSLSNEAQAPPAELVLRASGQLVGRVVVGIWPAAGRDAVGPPHGRGLQLHHPRHDPAGRVVHGTPGARHPGSRCRGHGAGLRPRAFPYSHRESAVEHHGRCEQRHAPPSPSRLAPPPVCPG